MSESFLEWGFLFALGFGLAFLSPMEVGNSSFGPFNRTLDGSIIHLEEEERQEEQEAQTTLVGKVITDRLLNKAAIKNMLIKAWGITVGLQVSDAGFNLFLFTFTNREDAQVVLDKTPWYVMNKLINLQWWDPQITMNELDFNRAQFLVQVQGLPLEFILEKNAGKILSQVGKVIEVEDPKIEGEVFRPFIRARVEFDLRTPLSTGCWIPRKNMSRIWAFIKYERLQDLCYNCGIIGHEQKNCKKEKAMSLLCEKAQRYSARVGVAPAKPRKMIVAELESRRKSSKERSSHEAEGSQTESEHKKDEVREITEEERNFNRERYEYEVRLEAGEGGGSLPSGGEEECQAEPEVEGDVVSTITADAIQTYKVPEFPVISNLRLQQIPELPFPVFRKTTRVDFFENLSRPGSRSGLGCNDRPTVDPFLTRQEGVFSNPDQLSRKVGYEVGDGELTDLMLDQRAERDMQKEKERIEGAAGLLGDTGGVAPEVQDLSGYSLYPLQGHVRLGKRDNDLEFRKPDWWAQEQLDNVVAFEKIQADLQAIREEVKAY